MGRAFNQHERALWLLKGDAKNVASRSMFNSMRHNVIPWSKKGATDVIRWRRLMCKLQFI